jgi:hypothetical protein
MTQPHPLDRPVRHAWATRQAKLAQGDAPALRHPPEYDPFTASRDASPTCLRQLAGPVPEIDVIWRVEADDIPVPPGTIA